MRKTRPDVRCDLSSVVPGYAADRLWTELADRGFTDFLVDVGGEVRTRGRNETGAPWQVAIERPEPQGDAIQRLVAISDLAITTAGDYRKYREVDGQRVAHILDPRTGRPLTHRLASVTVIDALAVRADAFDTALMVLGMDEGMALATKLNLAALFIERTGDGSQSARRRASRRSPAASRRSLAQARTVARRSDRSFNVASAFGHVSSKNFWCSSVVSMSTLRVTTPRISVRV